MVRYQHEHEGVFDVKFAVDVDAPTFLLLPVPSDAAHGDATASAATYPGPVNEYGAAGWRTAFG